MKKFKLSLFVAFIALAGVYTYLWYLSANTLEMAVIDQVQNLEKKGYRIAYGGIRVKGFPFTINIEIDDPLIEAPSPVAASISITGVLQGRATIFDPTTVDFSATQGVEIQTALLGEESKTVLKSEGLSAHMPLPKPLQDFKLTFHRAHIGALDVKTESLTVGLKLHESDQALNLYTLDVAQIDPGKKLVESLPQVIDRLQATLSLRGKIQVDTPLEDAIAAWYTTEGTLDIGLLSVQWGDLKVDLKGSVAVDERLQPLAAFSAKVYGLDDILTKLKDLGFIHENLLLPLKTTLGFLKESKDDGGRKGKSIYHKISLTLQDNDVSVGPLLIYKFPPLNWSKLGE